MNNKYENRLKSRSMRNAIGTTGARQHKTLMETFEGMTTELIAGFDCVPCSDLNEELMSQGNICLSTSNRIINNSRDWFDIHKIGKKVYLSYRGEPETIMKEKEVTKTSAITTVASVLADVAKMQEDVLDMTEFYENLNVDYEQVTQLNEMVRDTVFDLANLADRLAFTIKDE